MSLAILLHKMENVFNRVHQCISLDERNLTGFFLRRDFVVIFVRGGADKSIARSCAEMQVFSCYRG